MTYLTGSGYVLYNRGMTNTTETFKEAGKQAFFAGDDRIVPRDILVTHGFSAAREWYQGWDQANLAGPYCENAECAKPLTFKDIAVGDGLCAYCEAAERENAGED